MATQNVKLKSLENNMTYTVCISTLYVSGHACQYCNSKCYIIVFHYPQDGRTPLYTASSNGQTDVVRVLLENKADPNISDKVSYSIKTISIVVN